jgi:ssDNA-binding Zn-finger/Zn-ribbon topoisomerase 1
MQLMKEVERQKDGKERKKRKKTKKEKKEKDGANQALFLGRTGSGRFDEKRVIVTI